VIKKSLKLSTKILFILSIVCVLGFLSLFAWIITGPRSLSSITPQIERELSSINDNIAVEISESYIKWDNLERSIIIEASDISVFNKQKKSLANFPKISFEFSLINFFSGNMLASGITLIKPSFYIDTAKFGSDTKAANLSNNKIDLGAFLKSIRSGDYNFSIDNFRIKDANIFISNGFSDFVWHAKEGYIKIDNHNKIISELTLNFGASDVYLGLETSYKDGVYDNLLKFNNLPSYIVSDIFPNNLFLQNIDIKSSGNVKILISDNGDVDQASFKLQNLSGNLKIADIFPEKFKIITASMSGSFYKNFSSLALDSFDAKIDDSVVVASGNFSNLIPSPDFSPSIDAKAIVTGFNVNNLYKYWPLHLGEVVRTWVTTNITDGHVTTANGRFKFTTEYFEKVHAWQKAGKITNAPALDEDSIDALINVTGANVLYNESFPKVTDASGTVKFTGKLMQATATTAKTLDSNISNASATIEDMNHVKPVITVKGDFTGLANDAVQFLKAALKKQETTKVLDSIYQATGTASGSVVLSLPITKDLVFSDVRLNIDSKFAVVTLPAFINGNDITNANFDLKLNDTKLAVLGTPRVLDSDLSISYDKDFNIKEDSDYAISGNITAEKLTKLGLATIPFTENEFAVNVKLKERKDATYIDGDVDITDTFISIPKAAFVKEAKKKGTITFASKKYSKGDFELTNFSLSGDGFLANGNAYLSGSTLTKLKISDAKYQNADYSMDYKLENGKHIADIKGKSLDLSSTSFSEFFKKDPQQEKTAIDFNAEIKTIIMKNGEKFSDFVGNINCSEKLCSSVNMYAKIANDGFLALSVKPLGDRSSLMLESDNAGAFIKAVGISQHIQNGRLTIESTFSEDASGKIAQGLVQIHDFTAVKTPILGKLLTLASLQGISDLLNNKGIQFKRFSAPFNISNSIITLHNAKTAGSSIGITSEGTINMKTDVIDLNGAVVPAYAVNKILGDIPVVGNLIVGKKNEGILATKYKIKGKSDDLKISVNPLTILTPGFLRNIFDVF
jgi:hypothetical protein